MHGLRRQLGVIGRSSGFRLLFFSSLGSTLGTLVATVALVVDVKDRTNSGTWVSALLIVEFLPAVLIGLFFGPLLDRLSRRRLMVAADLVRAAVFCILPFTTSAGQIVALAAVAGFASGFFRPAAYAGLPNLVEPEDLPAANSVLQAGENVSWAAGPVLGGVIVAAAGPHPAYWIDAVSFVLSALLLSGIPSRLLQTAAAVSQGHVRDLKEGLLFVLRSPALRAVLIAWTIVMGAIAAQNTSEVFLAKNAFHAGDFGFGLLFGSLGLGLALGSLVAGSLVGVRPLPTIWGGSIFVHGLGLVLAAISPNVWIAAACCALAGLGNGGAILCNSLLVQRGSPDNLRGRAFTVIMSINNAVFGIGLVVGGVLTDRYGPRWVWVGAGTIVALASVVAYRLARGSAGVREPKPELAV